MSNFGAQNQFQGYGQQPPGGYGQQPQYGGGPPGMPGGGGYNMGSPSGPTPQPARRGTSKALPIMVAAGLAVGVCGGLVLVLGTGSSDAATEKSESAEKDESSETPDEKKEGEVAAGDTQGEQAGTPTTETPEKKVEEPEEPKLTKVTIKFEVDPDDAEVLVDGDEISSGSLIEELEEGATKKVKIEASAKGYHDWSEDYEIAKNDTVKISLKKKKPSRGTSRPRRPRRPGGGGSGGLIDL